MSLTEDREALRRLEAYHADLEKELKAVKNNITALRYKLHNQERRNGNIGKGRPCPPNS